MDERDRQLVAAGGAELLAIIQAEAGLPTLDGMDITFHPYNPNVVHALVVDPALMARQAPHLRHRTLDGLMRCLLLAANDAVDRFGDREYEDGFPPERVAFFRQAFATHLGRARLGLLECRPTQHRSMMAADGSWLQGWSIMPAAG